jgi:hypothetical protein
MSLAISSSSSFFLDISHFAAARGPDAVRKAKAAPTTPLNVAPGLNRVKCDRRTCTLWHSDVEWFTSSRKVSRLRDGETHHEGRGAMQVNTRAVAASVLPASLRRRSGSGCSYSSEQRLRPCGLSRNPTLCHLQLAWRRSAGLAQPAGQCAIERANLTVFGVRVCSDQGEDAHRQGDRDRHRV